jgi:hypothetical protein
MYRALIVALAVMAGTACAGDIYRWTDDNGQVHYGSRPGGADAREVVVKEHGSSAASGKANEAQRLERRRRLLESYERERVLKRTQQKREQEKREKLARVCKDLQEDWSWLNHPGPIYTQADGGKRNYLDEAARQEQKAEVRKQMDRYCR